MTAPYFTSFLNDHPVVLNGCLEAMSKLWHDSNTNYINLASGTIFTVTEKNLSGASNFMLIERAAYWVMRSSWMVHFIHLLWISKFIMISNIKQPSISNWTMDNISFNKSYFYCDRKIIMKQLWNSKVISSKGS